MHRDLRQRTRRLAPLALWLLACEAETPPRPESPAAGSDAPAEASAAIARYEPANAAVLTFAGERGSFADAKAADAIPEPSRGLVRVTLLDGPPPPPGMVWVGNFRTPAEGGAVELTVVPRDAFEELALGQGLSSKFDLPPGLAPPENVATAHGDVIVYKTAWCGVCKKVESYLKKKGVEFESKDIEKDPEAAAELQAKAAAGGVRTGSVPIIDVKGQLLVGFDRARLESLL